MHAQNSPWSTPPSHGRPSLPRHAARRARHFWFSRRKRPLSGQCRIYKIQFRNYTCPSRNHKAHLASIKTDFRIYRSQLRCFRVRSGGRFAWEKYSNGHPARWATNRFRAPGIHLGARHRPVPAHPALGAPRPGPVAFGSSGGRGPCRANAQFINPDLEVIRSGCGPHAYL